MTSLKAKFYILIQDVKVIQETIAYKAISIDLSVDSATTGSITD
jgi:hypothetical protein